MTELLPMLFDMMKGGKIPPVVFLAAVAIIQIASTWIGFKKIKSSSQDKALEQAMDRQTELDQRQSVFMDDLTKELDKIREKLERAENEHESQRNRYDNLSNSYELLMNENRQLRSTIAKKHLENKGLTQQLNEIKLVVEELAKKEADA